MPTAQIARVLIQPAAGDTGPLDYEIGDLGTVEVGIRVLVPLGPRIAVGIVTELLPTSPHARLRRILKVLENRPVVDRDLLELCAWVADYYLTSFGEAVTAALPGAVRMKMDRVVRAAPDSPSPAATPRKMGAAHRQLLEHLKDAGEQTVSALERRFGRDIRAAITALRRRGLITVEHELRPASGRTRHLRYYRAERSMAVEEAGEWMRRRAQSYRVYTYLAEHPLGRATMAELEGTFPAVDTKLRRLQRAGLVTVVFEEMLRPVLPPEPPVDRPVLLSTAQRQAVTAIGTQVAGGFATFLLWGVTGSGKTEVYLHSVSACLAAGKTALILVPEISLTHQIVDRVRARFGDQVAVLHSALADGERWDEWRRIAAGDVRIVVGARSAVFAPLPRVGLIIVDEEHDPAYKQEDGVRYNGRDVAVVRAQRAGCPVVLGSATPALETYLNARNGRYRLLDLPERVESRPLPTIDLIDLRRSGAVTRNAMVSPLLQAALKANLNAGNQSLVFLNRRGYSNFLQCRQCGNTLQCPNCSVSLTLHQRWRALRCHHCDHTIPIPDGCPNCGGIALGEWGAGTEQVETALRRLIAGARVARMDRDTTSRKGAQREILAAWERGDSDILVGTQMVAKGHDVHNVTLVGVLLADSALNFPDFRAAERTFQTLAQVAGRAGRGTQPGRVLVQTFQPQHPSLRFAVHHDYQGFAEHELALRSEAGYPPYTRLVQIRIEGESQPETERVADELKRALAQSPVGITVMGPAPAPLERLRRRFRWQLLLRANSSAELRSAARRAREAVRASARKDDIRVIVDVDPYSML